MQGPTSMCHGMTSSLHDASDGNKSPHCPCAAAPAGNQASLEACSPHSRSLTAMASSGRKLEQELTAMIDAFHALVRAARVVDERDEGVKQVRNTFRPYPQ